MSGVSAYPNSSSSSPLTNWSEYGEFKYSDAIREPTPSATQGVRRLVSSRQKARPEQSGRRRTVHADAYVVSEDTNLRAVAPWSHLRQLRNHVSADSPGYVRLSRALHSVFDESPLEDGMDHPADALIDHALCSDAGQRVLEWLRVMSLDQAHPTFASSVLRCMGRQAHPGTLAWRTELVRDALNVEEAKIRDAAVQAAESWADPELHDVLALHREPLSWLRNYIHDVLADLAGG